jgi:hypothetical protein
MRWQWTVCIALAAFLAGVLLTLLLRRSPEVVEVRVKMPNAETFGFRSTHPFSNNDAATSQLNLLKTPPQLYKQNHQSYPPKLECLWKCPAGMDMQEWGGPYLDNPKGELLDPWKRPYRYMVDGNGVTCSLSSAAEDGIEGTEDDIVMGLPN